MRSTLKAPKIIDYTDYRLFLKDRFEFMKAKSEKYSYRYLSKKIGATDNYFKYVFDCKKNISLNRASKTAKVLNLNYEETQYLIFSVIRQTVSEPVMANIIDNIINSYRNKVSKTDHTLGVKEKENMLQIAVDRMAHSLKAAPDVKLVKDYLLYSDQYTDQDIRHALEENSNKTWPDNQNFAIGMAALMGDFYKNVLKYNLNSHNLLSVSIKAADLSKIKEAQQKYMNTVEKISRESKQPDSLVAVYGSFLGIKQPPDGIN